MPNCRCGAHRMYCEEIRKLRPGWWQRIFVGYSTRRQAWDEVSRRLIERELKRFGLWSGRV